MFTFWAEMRRRAPRRCIRASSLTNFVSCGLSITNRARSENHILLDAFKGL